MKEQIDSLLKSKDLKNISIEVVEKILDNQMEEGILKEIPIVKYLVAAKNIHTSISDTIFIKKAMRVLLELGEISSEQRTALAQELDDENGSGIEKIMMAIDKFETLEKCKIYGRLCRLKASGEIEIDDFLRLTKLIQDAYLDDLVLVTAFKKGEKQEIWEGDYSAIITLGLLFQEPSEPKPLRLNNRRDEYGPEIEGGEIKFNYLLTNLGIVLLDKYDYLFPNSKK